MMDIGPGSEIDGFRLGEIMHVGTMASIYRLEGGAGPLPLIMKLPRLGPGERSVNVIAFEVCRMVLGALAQGPHHPTLVAFGELETTPYLVMEYIEGVRLSDWVRRAPIEPEEIARLGSSLALALHDLHRQGVVHLDLKPTNVLYRPSGEAVLIDFGLAHHSHYPDLLAEELRFPVGNWVYMAPEQVLGVRCDPRSDVYALGALLYELATGKLPFGHPRSSSELRQRLRRDAVPPRVLAPATPPWLQEIILRCLELDARDRYASAAELAFDLGSPGEVEVTERGLRDRPARWTERLKRRLKARNFEPAPCPPALVGSGAPAIVMVALSPEGGDASRREALREAARRAIAANAHCRIACATVVRPAASLEGEREEDTATGRHIKHLVELRRWARPLELSEERLTYHVLESDKPAAALVDYARLNDVEQILIGGPRGTTGRLFPGVWAQVVAEAPCSVTVVRGRGDA
jgi:nucleotide-binding universal stress UspA family protein